MQEVVDAGEVRILQQQNRKKWWRGQWGEVYVWNEMDAGNWEAPIGGREISILKQHERKKLLRDMPPPTFRPPLSSTDVVKPIFLTTHILKEFMKCGIIA